MALSALTVALSAHMFSAEPLGGAVMDWRAEAACRARDPELFFPIGKDDPSQRLAIRVCNGCLVRDRCLAWAFEHDVTHGVWGGLSEQERETIARRRAQVARQAS
jgi:WhiB family redox-sensing transcriptional regulator